MLTTSTRQRMSLRSTLQVASTVLSLTLPCVDGAEVATKKAGGDPKAAAIVTSAAKSDFLQTEEYRRWSSYPKIPIARQSDRDYIFSLAHGAQTSSTASQVTNDYLRGTNQYDSKVLLSMLNSCQQYGQYTKRLWPVIFQQRSRFPKYTTDPLSNSCYQAVMLLRDSEFQPDILRLTGKPKIECTERALTHVSCALSEFSFANEAVCIEYQAGLYFDNSTAIQGIGHAWVKITRSNDMQIVDSLESENIGQVLHGSSVANRIPIAGLAFSISGSSNGVAQVEVHERVYLAPPRRN